MARSTGGATHVARRALLEPRMIDLARAGVTVRAMSEELGICFETARHWWRDLVQRGVVPARRRGPKKTPHTKPGSDVAYTPKERTCLGGCGQRFKSEWPGERVCKRCKATTAWRMGA